METKIELQKQKIKDYRDYFGEKILDYDRIDLCSTEEGLIELLENHNEHIDAMCNEARYSLDRFKVVLFEMYL